MNNTELWLVLMIIVLMIAFIRLKLEVDDLHDKLNLLVTYVVNEGKKKGGL